MTTHNSRRRFIGGAAAATVLRSLTARGQDGATDTCILGREAAARGTELTMEQVLKENRKLEVDLTELQA